MAVSAAEKDVVVYDLAELKTLCVKLLERVDVPGDDAVAIIDNLVDADLRGVHSHGVVRLPIYLERLAAGANNPRPEIRTVRDGPSHAVIDGDNGMGQIVGMRAMEIAIEKGREGHCSFVSVRNSNHFGAAAYYVEQAAAARMIGFAFTIGGINHMTPWGGAEAILGNNPFAVAFPRPDASPIVLDMACSVAARGKIIVASKTGEPIPLGWAVGPDGKDTTDPVEALKGFVLPIAGPKGYALTMTIGLLSTMLSGAAFGTEVTHMYEDLSQAQNVGHLFGVLPISLFEDLAAYDERIGKAATDICGVERAPGVERIYLPGEREAILKAERTRNGVPIDTAVARELEQAAERFGI